MSDASETEKYVLRRSSRPSKPLLEIDDNFVYDEAEWQTEESDTEFKSSEPAKADECDSEFEFSESKKSSTKPQPKKKKSQSKPKTYCVICIASRNKIVLFLNIEQVS